MASDPSPFLTRVRLRNYKSIGECDVTLGPLTFLVGPNGSGKSNFLDALRFVSDCLRGTLRDAVRERGTIREVLWRGEQGCATSFSIELELSLSSGEGALYSVMVNDSGGLAYIGEERCRVRRGDSLVGEFKVCDGAPPDPCTIPTPPPTSRRDLYLKAIAGYPEFTAVFEHLRGMRFYNIEPQQIRQEVTSGKPADELLRDGKGALFVTRQVFGQPGVWQRIHEYLRAILPTLREFNVETDQYTVTRSGGSAHVSPHQRHPDCRLGEPRSLKFVLSTDSAQYPSSLPSRGLRVFDAQSISDGTLRAFGVLLALFQCIGRPADDPIPVVGIEEPEAALHPAAARVLFDALHEASYSTQVLVTTHSADLLDTKDLAADSLLVVDMADGRTVIGPADDVSKSVLRDRLSTAGELLRQNYLRTEVEPARSERAETD